MNNQSWIMLLGRRNQPIDGVRDYLAWLSAALQRQGVVIEQVEIPWVERGWLSALWWTWKAGIRWREKWIVVQYTALSWSTKGIPIAFLLMLLLLRLHRVRLAVMFHDTLMYQPAKLIHQIVFIVQLGVMRLAYILSQRSITNIPLSSAKWLPPCPVKAVYIPVGGSVPAVTSVQSPKLSTTRTIAVFGITPGVHKTPEIADIAYVTRYVKNHVQQLRLVALGGGTPEAAEELRAALRDTAVDLAIHGVVSAEEVSRILSAADLLLFVRGGVSTQRSSAMAGIACGLPVVAYANSATGHPLTEAGIITVPYSDRDALAKAVVEVVTNSHLRHELHQRSVLAHQTYFSWDVIARRYLEEVICN